MKKSLGAKAVVYPAPVFVVGSYDREGKPDAATASWGGICCSQPPCVAVSFRNTTRSYENIMKRKAFTISIPSEQHLKAVDYLGLISAKTQALDKWAETKLTPEKSHLVDAPYVKEFGIVLECKVIDIAEIGIYAQFVGEILDVQADSSLMGVGGAVDLRKLKPLVYSPDSQEYFGVGQRLGQVCSPGKSI